VRGLITVKFAKLTLKTAIERLLEKYNSIIFDDDNNKINSVMVLPSGEEADIIEEFPEEVLTLPSPIIETILTRQSGGYFSTLGTINGNEVDFLVDTGASKVVISSGFAIDIGLVYGQQINIKTASGYSIGYKTKLETIRLGDVKLQQVDALIMPDLPSGRFLLGMSFLRHFELIQRNDTLIIRNKN
jgi:aspartyl protease family protein